MSERFIDPGDYYSDNQELLLGFAAAMDRLAATGNQTVVIPGSDGKLVIGRGGFSVEELSDGGDALEFSKASEDAVRQLNGRLISLAEDDMSMLRQQLLAFYRVDEPGANERTSSSVFDTATIGLIQPGPQVWCESRYKPRHDLSLRLAYTSFHSSKLYKTATMYRAVLTSESGSVTDVCVTTIESRPPDNRLAAVYAAQIDAGEGYRPHTTGMPAPDTELLRELQGHLLGLE